MGKTRIKICGVRDRDIAHAAIDAGADALGFVFEPRSPRFIDPADAWDILQHLPPMVTTVALLVNPSLNRFCDAEQACPTDYTQLHGNETESLVRRCGPRVIKAVRFDPKTIDEQLARWDAVAEVDAILVDGSPGGQGVALDWAQLGGRIGSITTPIILAGGLTPDNVADAIRAVRPYAVDVSSGVERERGTKDPALIAAFCRAVLASGL